MLGVVVAGRVVLSLPLAEVPERQRSVGRDVGPVLLVVHHQQLYHGQTDGVVNGWVAIEARCHCHDGHEVWLQARTVKLRHGLVRHQHDFNIARGGHEAPRAMVRCGNTGGENAAWLDINKTEQTNYFVVRL